MYVTFWTWLGSVSKRRAHFTWSSVLIDREMGKILALAASSQILLYSFFFIHTKHSTGTAFKV